MIGSAPVSWLLTAVFAAAAVASQLPRRRSWAPRPGRAGRTFCLVMCLALIAMTWWAEPAAVTWLQVAGFGAATLWFGLASRPRLTGAHHALMAAAMVWMLTALSGMARPVPVLAISVLAAASCAAASVPWLMRAIGPGRWLGDPAAAGQAVMSAGMAAMLIVLL
jgi:hypothetical protein